LVVEERQVRQELTLQVVLEALHHFLRLLQQVVAMVLD
jgi:hypothetical protein